MATQAYRNKQRIVTITFRHPVTGTIKTFTARTKSGGGISGNSVRAFLGGMSPQVSLGGDPERDDITLTVAYTDAVRADYKWLDALVGRAEATISEQLNGVGSTDVYSGILDQVNPPDYDADSNDVQELEIVISANAAMA
jgi:hypothetical protein